MNTRCNSAEWCSIWSFACLKSWILPNLFYIILSIDTLLHIALPHFKAISWEARVSCVLFNNHLHELLTFLVLRPDMRQYVKQQVIGLFHFFVCQHTIYPGATSTHTHCKVLPSAVLSASFWLLTSLFVNFSWINWKLNTRPKWTLKFLFPKVKWNSGNGPVVPKPQVTTGHSDYSVIFTKYC